MVVTRTQHKLNKAWEKVSEEKRKKSRRIMRRIAWKRKLSPNLAFHVNHSYHLRSEARENKMRQQFVKNMFIKRTLNSTYETLFRRKLTPWPDQTMKFYYGKIKKVFNKIYCKINVKRIVATIKNSTPIGDVMIMEAMKELNY